MRRGYTQAMRAARDRAAGAEGRRPSTNVAIRSVSCAWVCEVVAGLACRARVLHMHDGCAGGRAYTYFMTGIWSFGIECRRWTAGSRPVLAPTQQRCSCDANGAPSMRPCAMQLPCLAPAARPFCFVVIQASRMCTFSRVPLDPFHWPVNRPLRRSRFRRSHSPGRFLTPRSVFCVSPAGVSAV